MNSCFNVSSDNLVQHGYLYRVVTNKTQLKMNNLKPDSGTVTWINGKPNFVDKSLTKLAKWE